MGQLEPEVVEALYDFDASHTDELSFRQRDLITVLQKLDGGWWEGCIGTRMGWFPESFVRTCIINSNNSSESAVNGKPHPSSKVEKSTGNDVSLQSNGHALAGNEAPEPTDTVKEKHSNGNVVLTNNDTAQQSCLTDIVRNIVEGEQSYVRELKNLRESIFWPLNTSSILTDDEYITLCGNIDAIIDIYDEHLQNLRSQGIVDNLGRIFSTLNERVRSALSYYCSNHPRAVMLVAKYRDVLTQFCRHNRIVPPTIDGNSASLAAENVNSELSDIAMPLNNALPLAGVLSLPFRHLERYPVILQEYLRYINEAGQPHLETRRAVEAFNQLNADLSDIRRQKELEIELEDGNIENYNGPALHGPIQAFFKFRCISRPEATLNGHHATTNKSKSSNTNVHIAVFQHVLVIMTTAPMQLSEFCCEAWYKLADVNVIVDDNPPLSPPAKPNDAEKQQQHTSRDNKLYFSIESLSTPRERWSFSSPNNNSSSSSSNLNAGDFLQRLANAIRQSKPLPALAAATAAAGGDSNHTNNNKRGTKLQSSQRSVGRNVVAASSVSSATESSTSSSSSGGGQAAMSTSSSLNDAARSAAAAAADTTDNSMLRSSMRRPAASNKQQNQQQQLDNETLMKRQHSVQQLKNIFRQNNMPSLRPTPPLRPAIRITSSPGESCTLQNSTTANDQNNSGATAATTTRSGFVYNKPAATYQYETNNNIESDTTLLNVIESYCSSSRSRSNINAESAKVIVPHDEKLLIEDDDGMIVGERSLIDTVYFLSDQMTKMQAEIQRLTEERSNNSNIINGVSPKQHQRHSSAVVDNI